MTKTGMLAAFCAVSVLLTGCGATSDEMEQRANQDFTSGNLDAAKRELESAQSKANKENLGADAQKRLADQMAAVNAAIEKRRISQEDDSRQQGAAALAACKADCDRKDWRSMMSDMKRAQGFASRANDPALNGAIDTMMRTQPFTLMRAREAYSEVCSQAGWSTVFSIFDLPGSFWMDLSSYVTADSRLEMAAGATGDSELTQAGHDVTDQWRKYMQDKKIAEATQNDNSTFGTLVNLASGVGSVVHAVKYANAQQRFEKRMNELLGQTSMPAPSYAPTRRDAPPAPPMTPMPTPVAAAPTTVPAGVPVAPSTTPAATRAPQLVSGDPSSRSATVTPAPTGQPNFDDINK